MHMVEVTEENLAQAGFIHSESWRESHRSFCPVEFVDRHSPEAQAEYLRREMAAGKQVWMLIDKFPVGIVSVHYSLIENLYVLPGQQRKGYGTRLLDYAIRQCKGKPSLWILDNNLDALRLYERKGFHLTGKKLKLTEQLFEMEMVLI